MQEKLAIIFGFAVLVGAVYCLCMRATPRKGGMRVIEHIFLGIILCYLCGVALAPFGVKVVQGPFSAASAGYLGLPGVALSVFAGLLR